jgi:uncharacterized membrane protein YjdF
MRSATQSTVPAPVTAAPRWLVGDWTRFMRDPTDVLRAALLAGALVEIPLGNLDATVRMLLTFGLTMVPRLLSVPRPFDFAFTLGMSLQAWGNAAGAFDALPFYNKVVHFFLPLGVAPLLYLILIRLRVVPDLARESRLHERFGIVLIAFMLGLSVGALYEMYEWFDVRVLGGDLQVGYGDTIGDLADDALGAICGGVLLLVWDAYGWGTRRRVTGLRHPSTRNGLELR